ncbi:MAG: NAD-dependent epimerase/dehydratase family protein [Ilumatobacter sp.]|uniref:NAD-dependent epimerase/dehydratase family protein n=1 Tax=Ilumatobacter sp. TaxID=1967498 RepID=UPI003C75FAF5
MRIFVAGASGVLGRRVVPALLEAGHLVTANTRDDDARSAAERSGATATTVDLFDPVATERVGDDHDAIVNVATSIPTGVSAGRTSGWAMNDRLRSEASVTLATAIARQGGRYVGESITFPYVDAGDDWIDEAHPRTYFWGNKSCVDAEAAADSVTAAGGVGIALRFAMFFADDSAHTELIRNVARRGLFGPPGRADGRMSWIHIDDAAAAVVAALDAPPGVYNVAEADPATRAEHGEALALAVGRKRLRRIPGPLVRLGGAGMASLARSQRISSSKLMSATGWEPRVSVLDAWAS